MNAIFTEDSFQNMTGVANRYGISIGAVTELTHALMMSNGTMAQFNIPELGGGGQWMQGGMTMVGDMFNNQLKYTVDGLCIELSNLLNQGGIKYKPLPKMKANSQGGFQSNFGGNWWGDLGAPNSTGSQNGTSYAIFSNIARLAIQQNGKVTVFDTLDNQIGGVGQQQGGTYSVTFTSQYGTVNLNTLPIVSGGENAPKEQPQPIVQNIVHNQEVPAFQETGSLNTNSNNNNQNNSFNESEQDIFGKIEKLAGLKDKGILSVEEFQSKKADLLARL